MNESKECDLGKHTLVAWVGYLETVPILQTKTPGVNVQALLQMSVDFIIHNELNEQKQ